MFPAFCVDPRRHDAARRRAACVVAAGVILSIIAAPPTAAGTHLGEPFGIAEATPIAELTAHPERYFNRQVRIEGVIASACTNEGCFIEVVPEDGPGEGIVVNFPGLTHLFPTDCAGARAVVEGLFYQKIYPASRVEHWQGHSFRPGQPVPVYSLVLRIGARAAEVGLDKGPVPAPGVIHAAATDRIDLAVMEFETEGFGTGRKVLAPGEVVDAHSTGGSREIVCCLDGEVTVRRGEASPFVLRAGEMTFLPPATEHEMSNRSAAPASYLFVFSKAPEPVEPPHGH